MNTEHLDTDEQRAFRLKAREWMAGRMPPRDPQEEPCDLGDGDQIAKDRRSQRILWDGGLAGITVPATYGGQGLDKRFEDIFLEEAEPYRLPWVFGNAFNIVLPDLLAHGSEHLKTLYIPAMLRGEHMWCQLLSEPSGGSDLFGLLTRAEKRGDKWVINGSKVWTSGGHFCDYGICLARTDPAVPKHQGLTMFIVDMRAPGVTINPIQLVRGGSHFCQEFFDDVEIPEDHVVGEVNGGWTVAQTHLAQERISMARGWHIGLRTPAKAETIEVQTSYLDTARQLGLEKDRHARALIGEAIAIDAVYAMTTARVGKGIRSGALPPTSGALSSLMAANTAVRRTALLSELVGPAGVAVLPGEEEPVIGMDRVCTHRIGGGTTEMQRNIISERHLELPREPSLDRNLPFNQLKHNSSAMAKS